jgi:Zn-dependent protease
LRVARVSGVSIYVGVDFLVFMLLAFSVFQQTYREELRFLIPSTVLLSVASSLLIALLLVLHEFAHILTGRRYRNDATAIQLNYFGAVAIPLRDVKSPREEFLVASAGPLLNIGIALACTAARSWAGDMLRAGGSVNRIEFSGLLYELSAVFGVANWAVAIFNLLPFFPMDGGRILRSVFWFLTGRRRTATRLAVCFTLAGIVLFGFFSFHEFRRNHSQAGIRWAAFAILLAFFTSRNLRENKQRSECD